MKDQKLTQIAVYAALIAALGLLPKFNIPFAGGIPITAQSLGIMLAGIMLGPWRGALAVLLFLFAVALGLPLLAGGRGGLGVFAGPTVGFLVGFPVAALACGWIMQWLREKDIFVAALCAGIFGGIVVLYAFGIPGLAWKTDMNLAQAASAMTVFLPGDVLKAVVAGLVARTVARSLPSAIASRTA